MPPNDTCYTFGRNEECPVCGRWFSLIKDTPCHTHKSNSSKIHMFIKYLSRFINTLSNILNLVPNKGHDTHIHFTPSWPPPGANLQGVTSRDREHTHVFTSPIYFVLSCHFEPPHAESGPLPLTCTDTPPHTHSSLTLRCYPPYLP